MNKKILYSIIGLVLVGGLFSAVYAGPIINTITLAGNVLITGDTQIDGNLNVDGTLTASNLAVGPHTVDTNAGTICATGELLDGDGNCIPIPSDGAPGVLGFYTVTTSTIFGPNQEGPLTVLCELGDRATGGGFSGDISGSLNIRTNAPELSSGIPVGWTGAFKNIGSSNNFVSLITVCADITP